jgi:ribosome assembly protein 1
MDAVRMRKGLFVTGKKLVKDAEKQKTLKKWFVRNWKK